MFSYLRTIPESPENNIKRFLKVSQSQIENKARHPLLVNVYLLVTTI